MDLFLLGFAFVMGLMSIASPCVLPIIPSYVVFLFGRGKVGIVSGTLAIYSGIMVGAGGVGLALSLVGSVQSLKMFYLAAAVLLFLLIIDTLGAGLLRQLNLSLLTRKKGVFTGFIFGLLLMLVAAPCAIPLFATTAIFALTLSEGVSRTLVLLSYAIGLGLPLMLFGMMPELSERFKDLSGKWWTKVRLLILVGTFIWLVWSFFVV
ncbi:MAG: cytochrome c biogenesis protein CcdA [Candidatus Methanomethyliaceae archaeon]